jgi:molybdopterin-synthase adenylyltransferase
VKWRRSNRNPARVPNLPRRGAPAEPCLPNASLARALLVGAGGLGSPAARVLARAGVGTIAIADDDLVDVSNLHRQVLHRTADAGRAKADSAADALRRIAATEAVAIRERVHAGNVLDLVRRFDVVLDGSDNFATKFLINDACVLARVPFVHAGAIRWSGQVLAVWPGAACYRCLFEELPPAASGMSCGEAGIVGPVAGVVGALQAEAAMALLDERAAGRRLSTLLVYDGLQGTIRRVEFAPNPSCRACGERPFAALDPFAYQESAC